MMHAARVSAAIHRIVLSFAVGACMLPMAQAQFVQQGDKLLGAGAVGKAQQGVAVALSADGNTAVVAGSRDGSDTGAFWVYTRSGNVWSQQGPKVVSPAGMGSLAMSGDGSTILIGTPGLNYNIGAAWVFVRSGDTWIQQGAKLSAPGGLGQGSAVALSADGNTALIGGALKGASWVFTRSGNGWTQQGGALVGTGGVGGTQQQGSSVALSADGNTALIGGPMDASLKGAAWVFTRSGDVWTQQGAKLVGTGTSGLPWQGRSVALSGDGNTALIGGSGDSLGAGAAWVFTRSGDTWTQQGSKLAYSGSPHVGDQAWSLALSGDGNTAIVGGVVGNPEVVTAIVYKRSGSTWGRSGAPLAVAGATSGLSVTSATISVALSADGTTAILGQGGDNAGVGAAWVFAALPSGAPVINTVSPSSVTAGRPAFTLTVNGANFQSGATVQWNGTALPTTFVSTTQLTASAPASLIASVGAASIAVANPGGMLSNTFNLPIDPAAAVLSSLSPSSATVGGPAFTLTVNGTGFIPSSAVMWNYSLVPTTVVSATQLRASVPASAIAAAGTFPVIVANPPGPTSNSLSFVVGAASAGPPAIQAGGIVSASAFGGFTSIAPGSWIEIYGSNLAAETRSWTNADFSGANAPTSLGGTRVTIGGQPAFIDYISPTQVNVQVPSGVPAGPQPVIVTTSAGPSPAATVTVNPRQPGLLAPSSFLIGGRQHVVATFSDGVTYVLPPGAIPGVPSRRAQPGDNITLYGIGFGTVTPNIPAGQITQQTNALTSPLRILFGQTAATTGYSGLAPNTVGLYQFNVVVPDVAANDATPVSFTLGGAAGSQTLYLAIQNAVLPQVQSLGISSSSVNGGTTVQGTVTLSANAPAGGAVVLLSSNSPAASTPPSVTVPAGSSRATFNISTTTVAVNQTVTLTATYGGSSVQATLIVRFASTPPQLTSLRPAIGQAGNNVNVVIKGSNLSTVTNLLFSPPTGITVSNLVASSTQVTATLAIAANTPAGSVRVSVSSPGGTSGAQDLYVIQAPPGQGAYDGQWYGLTSQGLPMSMIVSNNTIKGYASDFSFASPGFGCPIGITTVFPNPSVPVSGASFNTSGFTGTFQSSTQAGGTMDWKLTLPGCSASGTVTWTATKQ